MSAQDLEGTFQAKQVMRKMCKATRTSALPSDAEAISRLSSASSQGSSLQPSTLHPTPYTYTLHNPAPYILHIHPTPYTPRRSRRKQSPYRGCRWHRPRGPAFSIQPYTLHPTQPCTLHPTHTPYTLHTSALPSEAESISKLSSASSQGLSGVGGRMRRAASVGLRATWFGAWSLIYLDK